MVRFFIMALGCIICACSIFYFYYLSNFWCNAGIFACLEFTSDWAVTVFYLPTAIGLLIIGAGVLMGRKP